MLKTALDFIGSLTTRFWQIAFAVALAAIPCAYLKGCSDGKASGAAAQATLAGKTVVKGNKADTAAHGAVVAAQAEVEAGNAAASEAARDSDDPLRDGFNALLKGATK